MKAGIIQQYNMVFCGQGGWHKRVYHMHSDVIFCWVLWIWLSSWNFCLIFWFYFRNRLKMLYFDFFRVRLKICRGSSSAFGLLGSPGKFSSEREKNQNITFSSDCEKKSKYQKKVPTISQIHNISQKNVTIYIIFDFFCSD